MAIVAALAGLGVFALTVYFGNKVSNRWLRYLVLIIGIFAGLAVTGGLARNVEESNLAGQILGGLIIAYFVLKSLFGEKKS